MRESWCGVRHTTISPAVTSSASRPFRVGLLGHGTVGAAFEELLEERAEAIGG